MTPLPARAHRPGRGWFWSALGFLAAGAVLLLVAMGGLMASMDTSDARPGVRVPGERTFTLEKGHRYTVYVVRPEGATGADPTIVVLAPDGNEETLAESLLGIPETTSGEDSVPYGDLTAFSTGTYTLRAEAVPDMATGTRVTIGSEVDTHQENLGLGLSVFGVLLVVVGIPLGVVWLVVRSRGGVRAGT